MKILTNEDKIKLVNELITNYDNLNKVNRRIEDLFGSWMEGEYAVAMDNIFDSYLLLVGELIGDTDYGIRWFVYDNDCGREKYPLYDNNNNEIIIDSAESYINYLNLSIE